MANYRDWRDLLSADADSAQDAPLPRQTGPMLNGALADAELPVPAAATPPTEHGSASVAAPESDIGNNAANAGAGVDLPEEISVLMSEQQRLKAELDALTGKGPASQEDQRENLRFPVKAHTKESRIEERRLRLHDERLAMLKRRAAERAALQARAEQERSQARDREAQARRLQEMAERRKQELAAEAAANWLLRQRWQAVREAALSANAAQEKQLMRWQARQEQVRQTQRNQALVAASLARVSERRTEEEACAQHAMELRYAAQRVLQVQRSEQEVADQRAEAIRLAAQRVLQTRRKEARALEQRLDQRRRKQGE